MPLYEFLHSQPVKKAAEASIRDEKPEIICATRTRQFCWFARFENWEP